MKPISKTGLDYIDKSPLDYWWRFLNPEREPYVESKEQVFDKALRMSVINYSEFMRTYVAQPTINKRTNFGKSEYDSLLSSIEQNGQILLSASEHATILKMRESILNHPTTAVIFGTGKQGEKTVFTEINSGVDISFTPHFIHDNKMIVNLSSTKDASAGNFSKEALNFNHHKRASIQMDGTGIHVFVFVVVETSPPYKLQVHILDQRAIDLGRTTYIENCKTYAECVKTGVWVGLPNKILTVGLPEWAYKN